MFINKNAIKPTAGSWNWDFVFVKNFDKREEKWKRPLQEPHKTETIHITESQRKLCVTAYIVMELLY
jgi:hypothetical protein